MQLINFAPSNTSNFQFKATLDGQNYNCFVRWNIFGQRYYINIYSLQNKLIESLPLISSPDNYDISLTAGYFDTKMVFRGSSKVIEIGL